LRVADVQGEVANPHIAIMHEIRITHSFANSGVGRCRIVPPKQPGRGRPDQSQQKTDWRRPSIRPIEH
jgi:hypothetical protein